MTKTTEQQLEQFLRCGLGTFTIDLFHHSMMTALRSVLLMTAAGDRLAIPTKEIRDNMGAAWSSQKPHVAERDYIEGHKQVPFVAKKVSDFLGKYQILLPLTEYELILDQGVLVGEYGIARPWRKDEPLLCLSLRRSKVPQYYKYPDAVSLARWLHLQTKERSRPVQIMHLPLCYGEPWVEKRLSKPLVRRQLNAILSAMRAEFHFGRTGPHCEACLVPRCLEVTHVR